MALRHCFPRSISPGNSGRTGRTVAKKSKRENDRNGGAQTGNNFDGEGGGVVSKSVPPLICVFLDHHD